MTINELFTTIILNVLLKFLTTNLKSTKTYLTIFVIFSKCNRKTNLANIIQHK